MPITSVAYPILAAVGLGLGIAGLYRWARPPGRGLPGLGSTLLLLTPLITMVTLGVGSNIATAFTLVGTLAIVRFRTSIRDPQDTAYVIFAVAVGVAAGNGNLQVALVGSAILTLLVIALTLAARKVSAGAERKVLQLVLTPPELGAVPWGALLAGYGARGVVEAGAVDHKSHSLSLTIVVERLRSSDVTKLVLALLEHPEVRSADCRPERE
jgi:uncharacterized membrane protein YhiD involved in acid resistance